MSTRLIARIAYVLAILDVAVAVWTVGALAQAEQVQEPTAVTISSEASTAG